MNSVTKEGNPVAAILTVQVTGFMPWFVRFRQQRNEAGDLEFSYRIGFEGRTLSETVRPFTSFEGR